MNPILIVAAIQAAVDVWKSFQANQGPANPTPEYLEAQKQARKAMMELAESLEDD